MNLGKFRKLTSGFTRGCYFNIGILDFKNSSDSLQTTLSSSTISPVLSAFAASANLPSRVIQPTPITVQFGLPAINIDGPISYPPWTCTFYCDGGMVLRSLFLKWQELIYDSTSMTYNSSTNKWKSNQAYASILTSDEIPIHVFSFKGLWPSDVSGVTVNQQDSNVLQFTVTFTYDYFTLNDDDMYAVSLGMALNDALQSGGLKAVGNQLASSGRNFVNNLTGNAKTLGGKHNIIYAPFEVKISAPI